MAWILHIYDVRVNIAFWSCSIVTAASAVVSFSIAAVSLKAAKANVKTDWVVRLADAADDGSAEGLLEDGTLARTLPTIEVETAPLEFGSVIK